MSAKRCTRLHLLLFVLLASGMPLPLGAANEPAPQPELVFADSEYGPIGPGGVRGEGATAYLLLRLAPGSALLTPGQDFVRDVSIRSTTSGGASLDPGWSISMLETGPATGVFVGSFRTTTATGTSTSGLRPSAPGLTHPEFGRIFGDGVLRVSPGGRLLATWNGAPAEARWYPASAASWQGPAARTVFETLEAQVVLRINDPDLRRDPAAVEGYPDLLRAYSDSDARGESVALLESAVDSAMFVATLLLQPASDAVAGDGRLAVAPGDRLWLTYFDHSPASPDGQLLFLPSPSADDHWVFHPRADGHLRFGQGVYSTEPAAASNHQGLVSAWAILRLDDPDPAPSPFTISGVQVSVSALESDGEATLALRESLAASGQFVGRIALVRSVADGGPSDAAVTAQLGNQPWIRVRSDDTLRASYVDAKPTAGTSRTIVAEAVFIAADQSSIQLGPAQGPPLLVGDQSQSIVIDDPFMDRNSSSADAVPVRVRSTSNLEGIQLIAEETGPSTGVFAAFLRMGSGASGPGALATNDRDSLQAFYARDDSPGGAARTFASQPLTWRQPRDATIRFDTSDYARQAAATQCDWQQPALVTVEDPDQNVPTRIDQVRVVIVDAQVSLHLVATETGPDTGLFEARFTFGKTSCAAGALPHFQPGLNAGVDSTSRQGNRRRIEAFYLEPFDAAHQSPAYRSAFANWYEGTDVVRFEQRPTPGSRAVNLVHHDVLGDSAEGTPGTLVTVAAYAPSAPEGMGAFSALCPDRRVGLGFQEQPVGSRRWVSQFYVTSDTEAGCGPGSVSSIPRLRIRAVDGRAVTDQVTLVSDRTLAQLVVRGLVPPAAHVLPPSAGWQPFGELEPLPIEVDAPSANVDSNARDVEMVYVVQTNAPVGTGVGVFRMLETGPDTGRFRGSVSMVALQAPAGGFHSSPSIGTANLASLPSSRICFWDSGDIVLANPGNPDGRPDNDTFEPLFLHFGATCDQVRPGDVRLTDSGALFNPRGASGVDPSTDTGLYGLYPGGSVVLPGDLDDGTLLTETWAEYYANRPRLPNGDINPHPSPPRIRYADPDRDGQYDPREPLYADLDGSESLTRLDLRVAGDWDIGPSTPVRAFTRVTGGTEMQEPAVPLRPIAEAQFRYRDRDGTGGYSPADAVYVDASGNGVVSMGEPRITGDAGTPAAPALMAWPPAVRGGVAEGLRIPATLMVRSAAGGAPAFVRWVPGQDARILVGDAAGFSSGPRVQVLDDAFTGLRLREPIEASGTRVLTPLAGGAVAGAASALVARAEVAPLSPVAAAGRLENYTVDAAGRAAEPIADANDDGVLACDDLRYPAGVVCQSSQLDLRRGLVRYRCLETSSCSAAFTYFYRPVPVASEFASPDCGTCDVYHFRIDAEGRYEFGAAPPTGTRLLLEYRSTELAVSARSTGGGETEALSLPWEPATASYAGRIRLEGEAGGGNQALFVDSQVGGADTIQVRFADPSPVSRSAAAIAGPFEGQGKWRPSPSVSLKLFSPSSPDGTTRGTGPVVNLRVRDWSADVSGQTDVVFVRARNFQQSNDHALVPLLETGPHTGEFVASLSIKNRACTPSCPEADGALHFSTSAASFTVDYLDPLGSGEPKQSALFTWRALANATLSVAASPQVLDANGSPLAPPAQLVLRGSEATLFVAVRDPDRGRNPSMIEEAFVRVSSDSDPLGERIQLVETGPDTGVFVSREIRIETQHVPGNGKVYARDWTRTGERLYVAYSDDSSTGEVRERQPPTEIKWVRTYDGTVLLERRAYVGTRADPPSGVVPIATAYVDDGDLNRNPGLPDRPLLRVRVGRADERGGLAAGTVAEARLLETGANTGRFLARFSFTTATDTPVAEGDYTSATGAMAQVPMGPGDRAAFRVEYRDEQDSRGMAAAASRLASGEWSRAGVGVVLFDSIGYADYGDRARLLLIDRDLDVHPGQPDAAEVRVFSRADPEGFRLSMTESGAATGVFKAELGFSRTGSGEGLLHVGASDRVTATYEDASPRADRVASAGISMGDRTPPSTAWVPARPPEGLRGSFLSPVTISFQANEAVRETLYALGSQGTLFPFQEPIPFEEGVHLLRFRSIDIAGNEEPLQEAVIVVDLHNPTEGIRGLLARAAPGGDVSLSWNRPDTLGGLLDAFEVVVREESLGLLGNTTSGGFTHEAPEHRLHRYSVAVRDFAGREGPRSGLVEATPDPEAPVIQSVVLQPAVADLSRLPSEILVRIQSEDPPGQGSWARLLLPDGDVAAESVLRPGVGGLESRLGLQEITRPCLCQVVVKVNDSAGNSAQAGVPFLVTGPESQAPTAELLSPSAEGRVHVRVADNVALGRILLGFAGLPLTDATPEEPMNETVVEASTSGLVVGRHTLQVLVEDLATDASGRARPNRVSRNFTVEVTEGLNANVSFFLPTSAFRRADGSVEVLWEAPGLPPGVQGFQVWRAASPFELVTTLTDPAARNHIDLGAKSGVNYVYRVSYYTDATGPFAEFWAVPGAASGAAAKPSEANPDGEETPWWILGAFGVVAIAVVAILLILARRRPGQQGIQTVTVGPSRRPHEERRERP